MGSPVVRKYVWRGILIDGFIGLLFLIFLKHPKAYLTGLFFGGTVSILMFIALYHSTVKMVDKEPNAGMRYAVIQYLFRMGIFAAVLVVSAIADYISLYTTFLGLLSIKLAIYSDNICSLFQERR